MMQPCKDGAAGNHGSSLKRCDSPPPRPSILSTLNNSAASPPPA